MTERLARVIAMAEDIWQDRRTNEAVSDRASPGNRWQDTAGCGADGTGRTPGRGGDGPHQVWPPCVASFSGSDGKWREPAPRTM